MSELKTPPDLEKQSNMLKDLLFKAKLAAFGEYEGFTRGNINDVLRTLVSKAVEEDCYHFKLSLKKGNVWDEYEVLTCKGEVRMVLAKIDDKEILGKKAFEEFTKIRDKPYVQAIMEITKIRKDVLANLFKPLPKIPTAPKPIPKPSPPKPPEAAKPKPIKPVKPVSVPTPIEVPLPSVSKEIASKILPSILDKELDIKKLATVYTEVYGYRFRGLRIRLAGNLIELLMELRSTSSSWIKPEEMIKKLVYRHIGPRLDKWTKTKVPLKLVLVVNGKRVELAR